MNSYEQLAARLKTFPVGWVAGWVAGWLRNIGNKANLSPAGAGASLSLAKFQILGKRNDFYTSLLSKFVYFNLDNEFLINNLINKCYL